MTSEITLAGLETYSESLMQSCIQNSKIIGLVFDESTAEKQRADEWSDYDFFVITEDGKQEALGQNLSWPFELYGAKGSPLVKEFPKEEQGK